MKMKLWIYGTVVQPRISRKLKSFRGEQLDGSFHVTIVRTVCLICWIARTLQSRRTIARLCLLYKFRNNLAYVDNAELHPVAYSSTRSCGHAFKLPITKCDFYKFSFFPRSLQEWNRLPR